MAHSGSLLGQRRLGLDGQILAFLSFGARYWQRENRRAADRRIAGRPGLPLYPCLLPIVFIVKTQQVSSLPPSLSLYLSISISAFIPPGASVFSSVVCLPSIIQTLTCLPTSEITHRRPIPENRGGTEFALIWARKKKPTWFPGRAIIIKVGFARLVRYACARPLSEVTPFQGL